MKQKIVSFFSGRNGFDTLTKAVVVSSLVLMLVSGFVSLSRIRFVISLISWLGFVYSCFRIFSRNLSQRDKENNTFVEYFKIKRLKFKERKQYKYFKCPRCKAWQRVPKGRGEITICCRVCRNRFDKKT